MHQNIESLLGSVREIVEKSPGPSRGLALCYRKILAFYYRFLIPENAKVLEIGCGAGDLLRLLPNRNVTGIDLSPQKIQAAKIRLPEGKFLCQAGEQLSLDEKFDFIIISDTLNFAADVQILLQKAKACSHCRTRLMINFYNTIYRPFIGLLTFLKLKPIDPPCSWLSSQDVRNLLEISGWELISTQPRILFPLPFPLLERCCNRFLAPLLPWLGLTIFQTARINDFSREREYSVSVIIPARNESGNIVPAIQRIPQMGTSVEIIFVEGHSTDDTWEVIKNTKSLFPELNIKILQQKGMGKGDAVRAGFDQATGDILMILDADLTVPPEDLPKFYDLLKSGKADFANGVRLIYPMEEQAMRFLNMCANKFFSLAFSWVLGQPIKDTLCGTKVLFKDDYLLIADHRAYFGEIDPFGDFDLIFGAAKIHLKSLDIPIRYKDRTYGTTNISRWRHGCLLLRFLIRGALRLKFV